LPLEQLDHGEQLVAFEPALKLPPAHARHERSDVEVPLTVTYWPAVHAVHGVQLAWLAVAVVVKEPEPHAEQARSDVAVGSVDAYCPAVQFVHALQPAGVPSLLY